MGLAAGKTKKTDRRRRFSSSVSKSTIGPRRRVGIFIIILAAGRSITSREYTRPRARARSSRSTTPGKIGTPGQETDRLYPFTTPIAQWMRLGTKSTSFRGAGRGFGPADFKKTSSCTRMEIFLPQGNAPNGRRDYCVRRLICSLEEKEGVNLELYSTRRVLALAQERARLAVAPEDPPLVHEPAARPPRRRPRTPAR